MSYSISMISPCESKMKTGFYKLHVTSTGALITVLPSSRGILYRYTHNLYIILYKHNCTIPTATVVHSLTLHSGVVSNSHKTTKPFWTKVAFLFYFSPSTVDSCRCIPARHLRISIVSICSTLRYVASVAHVSAADSSRPGYIVQNFFYFYTRNCIRRNGIVLP